MSSKGDEDDENSQELDGGCCVTTVDFKTYFFQEIVSSFWKSHQIPIRLKFKF